MRLGIVKPTQYACLLCKHEAPCEGTNDGVDRLKKHLKIYHVRVMVSVDKKSDELLVVSGPFWKNDLA